MVARSPTTSPCSPSDAPDHIAVPTRFQLPTMPPPATPPLRCLVSLQSFETYWAYYVQSDALLYPQECKAAAREWVAAVTDVLREDPAVGESLADEILSEQPLDELLQIISSWAGTDAGYP